MSDFLKSDYGVLKLCQDMKLHASTMVLCWWTWTRNLFFWTASRLWCFIVSNFLLNLHQRTRWQSCGSHASNRSMLGSTEEHDQRFVAWSGPSIP